MTENQWYNRLFLRQFFFCDGFWQGPIRADNAAAGGEDVLAQRCAPNIAKPNWLYHVVLVTVSGLRRSHEACSGQLDHMFFVWGVQVLYNSHCVGLSMTFIFIQL